MSKGDKYLKMNDEEKESLFEISVAEFKKSIDMINKKFKVMEKKVIDMEKLADEFKKSSAALENLYLKDINQRA